MTGAARGSAKICHFYNPANLQGDAHTVRRHDTALNLKMDQGINRDEQQCGVYSYTVSDDERGNESLRLNVTLVSFFRLNATTSQ